MRKLKFGYYSYTNKYHMMMKIFRMINENKQSTTFSKVDISDKSRSEATNIMDQIRIKDENEQGAKS